MSSRIAVVNVQQPFIRGGAEILSDSLVAQLRARGFDAYAVNIPAVADRPEALLDHIVGARLVRLENTDRVIALKFPAYHIPHDNKVLWMLHQYRQAYDLWGTRLQGFTHDGWGRALRDAVRRADDEFLPEARRIYTNSTVTRDRLMAFNGLMATVLLPPLPDPDLFHTREAGDYIFAPSRLSRAKRQLLAVEAMAHTTSGVRLVIAGPPDTPGDERDLAEAVDRLGLADRVEVHARWVTDDEKAAWMAGCLACAYLPLDEDSYGYVTLEAFQARKPVVSLTDSGKGVLALVADGETGWVAEPSPRALGEAFDRAHAARRRAHDLGDAGQRRVTDLGISWDHVIEELTR
ncbi:MAG: glycosyltransferase family 4 protein [Thermoleophilia bacterium]|nr:glycosyltransferase family 4 protein [Thermoleophilia bacterium]